MSRNFLYSEVSCKELVYAIMRLGRQDPNPEFIRGTETQEAVLKPVHRQNFFLEETSLLLRPSNSLNQAHLDYLG